MKIMQLFLAALVTGCISTPCTGQQRLTCKVNMEYRRYCFEGKDTTIWSVHKAAVECPEAALESQFVPVFDTVKTWKTIRYDRLDVRTSSPEDVYAQLMLMFEMQQAKNPNLWADPAQLLIPLFWDNYFDNAHNLSGQAFIAKNPGGRNYSVAVQFGQISKYDVIQKEKIIGSPWPEMNPGGTIYYNEDGQEILRLIYGKG